MRQEISTGDGLGDESSADAVEDEDKADDAEGLLRKMSISEHYCSRKSRYGRLDQQNGLALNIALLRRKLLLAKMGMKMLLQNPQTIPP